MPYKDPAARAAYAMRWQRANPERRKASYQRGRAGYIERARRRRLAVAYGITPEQYEEMLKAQGGVCAICLNPPKRQRLSVDHCHRTGRVRGLLCARCNAAIGRFQDNAETLRRAATYLER